MLQSHITLISILLIFIGFLQLGVAFFLWHILKQVNQRDDATVSQIISGLIHDTSKELQTMFAILANLSSELTATNSPGVRRLNALHDLVSQLDRSVKDIQMVIKFGTSIPEEIRSTINMAAIAQNVTMTMHQKAEQDGVCLYYDGNDTSLPVWGNERHFERVLINLIDNGIKYRNPDLEQCNVLITVRDTHKGVEVEVADNGKGMDRKRVKQYGEEFTSSNVDDPDKGSRLGAYLVRKIVEKNKGQLYVESHVGHGTKVTFILPMIKQKPKQRRSPYTEKD